MKNKTCRRCRQTLPLTAFGDATSEADGLNRQCKRCYSEQRQERNRRPATIKRGFKRVYTYPAYSLMQRAILVRVLAAHREDRLYPAAIIDAAAARRLVMDGLITIEPPLVRVTPLGIRTIDHILDSDEGYLTPALIQNQSVATYLMIHSNNRE